MGSHEVDDFGGDFFRGDGEVALVFTVFIIDQNDHAAVANLLDGLFHGGKAVAGVGEHALAS